jgi:hypothetical protein
LLELGSELLNFEHNYWDYRGISLYNLYLITLIKNWEYNFVNLKILFKFIFKEAKRYQYVILEQDNDNDDYYYFYV